MSVWAILSVFLQAFFWALIMVFEGTTARDE